MDLPTRPVARGSWKSRETVHVIKPIEKSVSAGEHDARSTEEGVENDPQTRRSAIGYVRFHAPVYFIGQKIPR